MKSDEAKRRIEELVNREQLQRVAEERTRAEQESARSARLAATARERERQRRRRVHADLFPPQPPVHRPRARTPEDLLERFTPEEAFAFIYEHTVPPANDDGPALLASYPELAAAAPDLVADMAVAFRIKAPDEYADYFARVAQHHGVAEYHSLMAARSQRDAP